MSSSGSENGAVVTGKRPLLCLAASGGGHVRQLLDLEPLWRDYPHFFVTEETSLGRSIARDHETAFVPHFALGQARLGSPVKMLAAALRSAARSARIVLRHRPRIVITTGAGSQLFVTLWARLLGARIILIDSFARFDRPSAFARLAGPLAHLRIAQSEESARHWPGAKTFDPLRQVEGSRPSKSPLLFATVGATLPFERLVNLVVTAAEAGLIPERIVLQTGVGGVRPEGFEVFEELPFERVKELLQEADIVVCHGGTGSIITALREWCRVIVIPRRFERGEHYDNHQAEITSAFVARGLVVEADDDASFAKALEEARSRQPVSATTDPAALIDYLRRYIEGIAA